jgi:hypothetical protein
VDIDFSVVFIAQNKIPSPGVLQLYVFVASRAQQLTQLRYVPLLNGYVQVLMSSALLTKEGINAPAAINPDFDPQVFQGSVEINDVNRGQE